MTGYTFNQLFDFTRTTSGTFVGSNGLLQTTPASVNLLTFTQEFDNAGWTKLDATVTANNAIAPDGTSTADKLVEGTGAGQHALLRTETVSSAPVTYSVYAKAAERSWVSLYIGAANTSAFFNLATGVVGTVQASVTASITSVGNGWYRCSITAASVGSGALTRGIYVANADNSNSYTGNGTSGIFLWGAQLELGSTATTYARNNGGVFPPRFDYDPVTLAPRGILIEEQRTNFEWSQDLDNAFWTKSGASVAVNTTTAPDGTTTADKLVENTATSTHFAARFPTIAAATSYSFSVYIKAAGRTFTRVLVGDTAGANGVYVDANLATGATATGANGTGWTLISASATAVGNGWFRIIVSGTNATATTGGIALIYPSSASGVINYLGDGVSGLFVWGAQFETGAFATSYIPTSASQVTRTADVCAISAPMFAPWYVQSAGTFVIEFQALFSGATSTTVFGLTADANVSKRFFYIGAGSDQASTFDGTTIVTAAGDITGPVVKVASVYDASGRAIVSNGGAVASGAVAAGYSTASSLNIGNFGGNSGFGHIRRVTYYPFRASNNQLQALTT